MIRSQVQPVTNCIHTKLFDFDCLNIDGSGPSAQKSLNPEMKYTHKHFNTKEYQIWGFRRISESCTLFLEKFKKTHETLGLEFLNILINLSKNSQTH